LLDCTPLSFCASPYINALLPIHIALLCARPDCTQKEPPIMASISDMEELSSDCMSDALSELSRSPSPPPSMLPPGGLPTPPRSHNSPAPSPSPSPNASMTEDDSAPPAKRRRLSPSTSMPRETRHLDLKDRPLEEQPDEHDKLVKALRNKKKIVVIAGAGISVNAGSEYHLCLC
jgi:hypothetical protein